MIALHNFLKCSAACSVCVHVLSTRGQSVLTVNVFLQQGPDTFCYGANIMTKQFEFELCKFELLTSVI